jgi:hypothetical protein
VSEVADVVDVVGAQALLDVGEPATARVGSPRRNGTSGCMPAVVKSTVGSFSGTSGADGMMTWPRSAKKSRYR